MILSLALPAWLLGSSLVEAGRPALQPLLTISQTATGESGSNSVSNGEQATFTVKVTNTSGGPVTNIRIIDRLPQRALADIRLNGQPLGVACQPPCQLEFEPKRLAGLRDQNDVDNQVLQFIEWSLASLQANQSFTFTLSGRVMCQVAGNELANDLFVFVGDSSFREPAGLTVHESTTPALLSRTPTWCSDEEGGGVDLAWGDFDGDDDNDLAIGSTAGVIVYRNQQGLLEQFWKNDRYTLGVRWANVDRDPTPELIAVGDRQGRVYIYEYDAQAGDDPNDPAKFTVQHTFDAPAQLLQVEARNFDDRPGLDLIVSAAAVNTPCSVLLYHNDDDNQGRFSQARSDCISAEAVAALAPNDYDQDGDPDLAISLFLRREIHVLINTGQAGMPFTGRTVVAGSLPYLTYDLAWKDYDHDGRPDLAAAFPLHREVRLYRSVEQAGVISFSPTAVFRAADPLSPMAIDWGDFNGDGAFELAVAGSRPRLYDPHSDALLQELSGGLTGRDVRSVAISDYDNDGDTDVAFSHYRGPAVLFTTSAGARQQEFKQIPDLSSASSVAWGDWGEPDRGQADGDMDLFFGAGFDLNASNLKIYFNNRGQFDHRSFRTVFSGPNPVALGDVNGDNALDIAQKHFDSIEIYLNQSTTAPDWSANGIDVTSLAWGDPSENSNHKPALLAGVANGPNLVYVNTSEGGVALRQSWSTAERDDTRSVAWADFDNDLDLDFAVGNNGQPNRIYRNEGYIDGRSVFNLVWSSPEAGQTRSIAWADYDGDGDPDLVSGDYDGVNYLYPNQSTPANVSMAAPVPISPRRDKTTSLAWGDWNNDGRPDLAVGNAGEADVLYLNRSGRLTLLWRSEEALATTGLAWGDKDGDGDLDLAVSHEQGGGFYENDSVLAVHHQDTPAPNAPPYLTVEQPGQAATGYFFSSAEMLSGPATLTQTATITGPRLAPVPIPYTLFDPTRSLGEPNQVTFEYSLNGRGRWEPAVAARTPLYPTPVITGRPGVFWWDVQKEEPPFIISNEARFRICADYNQDRQACAASPPFRIRAATCQWPDGAEIIHTPEYPQPGEPVQFMGDVKVGDGQLFYTWDFGDEIIPHSVVVERTFPTLGRYPIILSVRGEPCPANRTITVTGRIEVGGPLTDLYLPIIGRSGFPLETGSPPAPAPALAPGPVFSALTAQEGVPTQATGLRGVVDSHREAIHLTWSLHSPAENVTAYHIYRSPRRGAYPFRRLAVAPAGPAGYTDETGSCGYKYFVTAVNSRGESGPSRAVYYSPRCQEESNEQ